MFTPFLPNSAFTRVSGQLFSSDTFLRDVKLSKCHPCFEYVPAFWINRNEKRAAKNECDCSKILSNHHRFIEWYGINRAKCTVARIQKCIGNFSPYHQQTFSDARTNPNSRDCNALLNWVRECRTNVNWAVPATSICKAASKFRHGAYVHTHVHTPIHTRTHNAGKCVSLGRRNRIVGEATESGERVCSPCDVNFRSSNRCLGSRRA